MRSKRKKKKKISHENRGSKNTIEIIYDSQANNNKFTQSRNMNKYEHNVE